MSVQQASLGQPLPNITIPTTTATVVYQLGSAAVGGIAGLIAGQKLAGLSSGVVSIWELVIPILAGGLANVLAASLLPGTPISQII